MKHIKINAFGQIIEGANWQQSKTTFIYWLVELTGI